MGWYRSLATRMLRAQERANVPSTSHGTRGRTMDQSEGTGSEAPQTPPPASPRRTSAPAPTTQWAPPPAPVQAGPAGFVYADVPNRAIAYILDAILIGIINIIAFAILAGIGLSIVTGDLATGFEYNYVAGLILGLVGLADQRGVLHLHVDRHARHARDEGPRHADRQCRRWQDPHAEPGHPPLGHHLRPRRSSPRPCSRCRRSAPCSGSPPSPGSSSCSTRPGRARPSRATTTSSPTRWSSRRPAPPG